MAKETRCRYPFGLQFQLAALPLLYARFQDPMENPLLPFLLTLYKIYATPYSTDPSLSGGKLSRVAKVNSHGKAQV